MPMGKSVRALSQALRATLMLIVNGSMGIKRP